VNIKRPLRITLVADARSPTAQSWFDAVVACGHSIQVLSTYPVRRLAVPCSLVVLPTLPVALGRLGWMRGSPRPPMRLPKSPTHHLLAARSGGDSRTGVVLRECRLGSELLFRRIVGSTARSALDDFQPDIVHALRIPYEAILIAPVMLRRREPFLVSTWGNDFTLCAALSPTHRYFARRVVRQVDGLHCDCERDLRLARALGYRGPSLIAPGSGGIDVEKFVDAADAHRARDRLQAPRDTPIIFNPRSYRDYVRNDVFFAGLPAVFRRFPAAIAVTVGMDANNELRRYASDLGISEHVRFLPAQDREAMADLFAAATVTVSPSTHDGTPNSILEAMACGSFPIVGDIASLREWIEPGVNGFAVDPNSVTAVSEALIAALSDTGLRGRAAARNSTIVRERASRDAVRPNLEEFYGLAARRESKGRDR
jgi:glycosyltransferase involved in cell wall biosynthesis